MCGSDVLCMFTIPRNREPSRDCRKVSPKPLRDRRPAVRGRRYDCAVRNIQLSVSGKESRILLDLTRYAITEAARRSKGAK